MSNSQCKIGVYIADMSSASGGLRPHDPPKPRVLTPDPNNVRESWWKMSAYLILYNW